MPNSLSDLHILHAWEDNQITERCTQGEYAGKVLQFKLVDKDGAIDLTDCIVQYAIIRPDKSEDLLVCSVENGIVKCNLTYSATSIAGIARGEIRVISGSNSGVIKFYGVNLRIYKGVSDDVIEQSDEYSALIKELQKVALLTPEGTAEMDDTLEHGGTNPVASGVIFDNTMKYKYIQTSEINDSTRADYVYHGIDEVGYYFVMICVRNSDGSRKTQYKFYTSSPTSLNNGKIVFRTYNNTTSTWGDWTPIGNTANIADNAVTNEKIADDAITNEKIRDNEISLEKLDFDIPDILEGIISKTIIENYDSLTPDVTFNAINDDVAEYLNSVAYTFTVDNTYDSDDYTSTNIPNSMDSSVNELPNGGTINVPTGGSKIVIYDTVKNTQWADDLSGSTYTIKNLIPNRLYTYIIKDSDGDTLRSGTCKASGQVRFIDAGNVTLYSLSSETTEQSPLFNVRDIGGWECDGGHLKYGLIYRGSQLNGTARNPSNQLRGISISAKQQEFFKDFLGIKDEIDLRQIENDPDAGDSETAGDDMAYGTADDITDTALGLGVDYILVPIKSYLDGVILTDVTQNNRYATLIKRVASDIKQNKPCYIHCMEGADRTATLCMLIEAICGVSRNSIERDYELTSFSKKYSNTRNTRLRTNANWWGNLILYLLNNTAGDSFRDKIIDYVLKLGVTIDEINTIRDGLIEGTPEKIKNPYSNVSVTTTLTDVYADKDIANAVKFQPLKINLYPKDGYVLSSITLTMGGSDVKAIYYSDGGRIRIPKVTGDVMITAQAVSIEVDALVSDSVIPQYVIDESESVLAKAFAHKGLGRTIRFIAVSDSHNDATKASHDYTRVSNLHCGQAVKYIADRIPLDFVASLGDMTWAGVAHTTAQYQTDWLKADIQEMNMFLKDGFSGVPNIRVVGNHDQCATTDSGGTVSRLQNSGAYQYFGRYNAGANDGLSNYGYYDIENVKLRIIYLNTSDTVSTTSQGTLLNVSQEQKNWLCETLIDVNSKSDAANWKILLLSHAPLDMVSGIAADILISYTNGGTYGSYTFTNHSVKIIGNCHGHTHCYNIGYISDKIRRFTIPNSNFYDNNHYQNNANYSAWNEDTTYPKTENSRTDTSFSLVTVDLDSLTCYVDNYGAGYDREFSVDYNNVSPSYTNQIPISVDTNGNIYNGTGYKDDTGISSAGVERTKTGNLATGFIPYNYGDTIRIDRFDTTAAGDKNNGGVFFYDESKTYLGAKRLPTYVTEGKVIDGEPLVDTPESPVYDAGAGSNRVITSAKFIRVVFYDKSGQGESLIVTINEEM